MIRQIHLLRNIGNFHSVNVAATIALTRLVLIYAENGRGKTTLAAVLRSLSTGDPIPITERRTLASTHPPHVVLDCEGDPSSTIFQNGAWNRTFPRLVVFDDVFVDANIHSGLAVDARHRQNLHEVVLGAQGVALSRRIQQLVSDIEDHNRTLRVKRDDITRVLPQGLSVDDFCALPDVPGVDAKVEDLGRVLAAARDQDAVRTSPLFETLVLPGFDTDAIDRVLEQDLPSLDEVAVNQVQAHVSRLGGGGEQWLVDGMRRLSRLELKGICPFCAQGLTGSALITHYRAYFSAAYRDLRKAVAEALEGVENTHGGNAQTAFERAVRMAGERRAFWSRFCKVPEVHIDTAVVVRAWNAARDAMTAALNAKQSSPLERLTLDQDARDVVAAYDAFRQEISNLGKALIATNDTIRAVQEQVKGAQVQTIERDLQRLHATKRRHSLDIAPLCTAYSDEKASKARTEFQRAKAKTALEDHKANAFPASQTAINDYLRRFNTGFRLGSVSSTSTRGGPTCNYDVVINETSVSVDGGTPADGEPSFRNTLSSGDRNTLALAFFFASLDQDPDVANSVVVIDDPISSLDEHRSLATAQEVRQLAGRTGQAIVLSHDKRFLCRVWEGADRTMRLALEIARDGRGSTVRPWDVSQDAATEHDRRHARLRDFVDRGTGDLHEIARSIRPHLEAFLRVAFPEHFPPGGLLGRFVDRCRQRVGDLDEILDQAATKELEQLKEYAGRFHHDANPAWETEVINDTELRSFVERALAFAR